MFRLSQKADYGLILLSNLVLRQAQDKPTPISQIAKRNKISAKFLSQVAQDLKKAGILKAKEGVNGGYSLAKKPQEIKIMEVLEVLEGEFFEGRCFREECSCICGAKGIWREMKEQIQTTLSAKTVADLVSQVRVSAPKYS